jgi:hypothetical protein
VWDGLLFGSVLLCSPIPSIVIAWATKCNL